jgi:hypothetical protein
METVKKHAPKALLVGVGVALGMFLATTSVGTSAIGWVRAKLA